MNEAPYLSLNSIVGDQFLQKKELLTNMNFEIWL